MAMRKAQRKKAKLRLGMSGPAGAGKTLSSLLMAYGITGDWEDICLIDTENHSGDLYADYHQNGIDIGEYNIIDISAPYSPEKYIAAIKECEREGIKAIVIDSLTHAWAGDGGLLDKKGQIEKKTGNGWTAWRDITPLHNQLVETILQSSCHVICTLRAKMEHVQEKDSQGKTVIRKVGMNPIQRDGMEYEFTVFIDIDQDHQATCSKDRTSIFDGKMWTPGIETGRLLLDWLETGIDAPKPMTEDQKQIIKEVAQSIGKTGQDVMKLSMQEIGKKYADLDEVEAGELIAILQAEADRMAPEPEPAPFSAAPAGEKLITEKTMKKLHAAGSDAGMDHDALHNFVYLDTGIDSLSKLTEEKALLILEELQRSKLNQAS